MKFDDAEKSIEVRKKSISPCVIDVNFMRNIRSEGLNKYT